jgi:hypothetical protein
MSERRAVIRVAISVFCLALVAGTVLVVALLPERSAQAEARATAYRLTTQPWRAEGLLSGSGYLIVVAPTGIGTPCCCVYLPCALRSAP